MAVSQILVATDGSPGASRAVKAAAELAKALDSDLLIVTQAENISITEMEHLVRSEGGIAKALDLIAARTLLVACNIEIGSRFMYHEACMIKAFA